MDRDVYPLTIVKDRYSGTYSGGEYTAWELLPDEVPSEIWDEDVPCAEFWWGSVEILAGRGKTPEEAIEDLESRLRRQENEQEADNDQR